jgi:hypothetical protein
VESLICELEYELLCINPTLLPATKTLILTGRP